MHSHETRQCVAVAQTSPASHVSQHRPARRHPCRHNTGFTAIPHNETHPRQTHDEEDLLLIATTERQPEMPTAGVCQVSGRRAGLRARSHTTQTARYETQSPPVNAFHSMLCRCHFEQYTAFEKKRFLGFMFPQIVYRHSLGGGVDK